MSELKQLETQRAEINDRIRKINEEECRKKIATLFGKCFKFRNSYSLPESESDYWYLYHRTIGTTPNSNILVFSFQEDKDGKIEITPSQEQWHVLFEGREYEEITVTEFYEEWSRLKQKLAAIAIDNGTKGEK